MSDPPGRAPVVLRIERTFDAPAPAVFDAWTSEEVLRRWWRAEPDWETPRAEVDLRVGGRFRVAMRNPHDGAEHSGGGEFLEIDRPRRLAFTWTWDGTLSSRRLAAEPRQPRRDVHRKRTARGRLTSPRHRRPRP